MIQLAWRFLLHQKSSALAQWYRTRTANARAGMRKTLIVGLARKLLVALWRFVTTGLIPTGPDGKRAGVFGGSNIHILKPEYVDGGKVDEPAAKAIICFWTI